MKKAQLCFVCSLSLSPCDYPSVLSVLLVFFYFSTKTKLSAFLLVDFDQFTLSSQQEIEREGFE